MADIADIANERAENHLAKALAKQVGRSAPESHPDFNGVDCVSCLDPLPPVRITWGRVRCIDCQRTLESRRARGLV